MSDHQKLAKQMRLDDLVKAWGPDPRNWGIPRTSKLLNLELKDLPRQLIMSLHRIALRTRTPADRDFVTGQLLTQVTDRKTDALFEPPKARLDGDPDDLLPSDVDHVHDKLDKTFQAVDALYEVCGGDLFSWFPDNHKLADSALAWDIAFTSRCTALMKAHPKGQKIMSTKVFPSAIESRRTLKPNSPDFITTADLMSAPDIYTKVAKEMPELEEEPEEEPKEPEEEPKEPEEEPKEPEEAEKEQEEQQQQEKKAEKAKKAEKPTPFEMGYRSDYGKRLAERLAALEVGYKGIGEEIEKAKEEMRRPY